MTTPPDHASFSANISRHYTDLFAKYGDSAQTAQYPSRDGQEARFRILGEIGIGPDSKILDFGCGLGDLLGYLKAKIDYRGSYVGYDLSDEILEAARAKWQGADARFESRNIFETPPAETFDYAVVCGTFNVGWRETPEYILKALGLLFASTTKGLAFNMLSTYVDYFDPGLHYVDPETVFAYCKEHLSPAVTLRHDYLLKPGVPPYEYTIYVHRVAPHPRKRLAP